MRSRSARSGMRSSRSSPSKPAATSSTCRLPAAALHSSHAPRRRPQVREYRYCRRAVQPAERRSPHALHRLLPAPRHGHGVITRRHHERGLDDAHGRYGGLRVRDGGCDAQAKARDHAGEESWSRLAHKFRRIKRALYRARATNAHRDTRVCSLPAENIGNRGNSREERRNKLAELCTWYYRVTGNTERFHRPGTRIVAVEFGCAVGSRANRTGVADAVHAHLFRAGTVPPKVAV